MTSDASLDASLGDASATLPAKARIDVSSIGRFDIDAEIGKGGMAVVYAATDRESGERVALKVMTSADAQATERFHREVKAASQLVHPGICRVIAYGVDVHDGGASRPFLAMEYVDGGTLFALSKKAPVVPGVIAAEILRQLLEALACAHAAGVVHRDLKPQNVMITPAGSVKLLDFGIAKSVDDETLTQTGMLVGTPAFMSPEQARSLPLDGRSDLFSAAMTIASVLRKSPHRFSNGARMDPTQILMRVAYEPHGPVFEKAAHCPVALDFALAPMTTLMPEARVPSASAALIVLRESGVLPKEGPALLAQFVHKTAAESERLCAAQRAQEIAFADAVSKKAGGEVAAALALHRAWHLTPDDDTAARSRAFNQQHKLSFDETDDARIVDLLKSYDENPSHAGVLKALADRYKALGRVRHAAIYLWRYAAERPDDASATQQLSVMLEGPSQPQRGTDVGRRLSTKSIMSGVKSGGLKKPVIAAASNPTRHMQRPSVATTTRRALDDAAVGASPAAPMGQAVFVHGARDGGGGGSSKLVLAAVVAVALSVAGYFVVSSLALAKNAVVDDKKSEEQAGSVAAAHDIASALTAAEGKLAAHDPDGASAEASRVLLEHPSLETGRAALWIRARAEAQLNQRAQALKDCETYLDKATSFDDPNLVDVKRLMEQLRAPPTGAPRGLE